MTLKPIKTGLVDGENNRIECAVAYSARGDGLARVLAEIRAQHGERVYLLPLSGRSGGGGIFQQPSPTDGIVVGLQIEPATAPRIRTESIADLTRLHLDEIIIDIAASEIAAGAGITLEQLNRALAETIGGHFKVLGADLTSYTYAQVGATFMTGGMGPQRRYFSDSVTEVALYDGRGLRKVSGDALPSVAGSYGWSGLVTAVRCVFQRLPEQEVAFAIPVDNRPDRLADLLAALAPFCYLRTDGELSVRSDRGSNLILGLEHVTVAAMQPMLKAGNDNQVTHRAAQLVNKCEQANADGVIFVNGFSNLPVDEFLFELVDDADTGRLTIADIPLDHTEVFTDPEQMRALREAVPFAARTQAPQGDYSFKGHTDAVIRLNPDRVREAMQLLWLANCTYVREVTSIFAAAPAVRGEILVYGHLNPYGVDPHNRLTIASDDKDALHEVCLKVEISRDRFLRALQSLCENTDSRFVGGEKGACSEQEMFAAFGGPDNAPAMIRTKFVLQSAAIRAASEVFSWRAMAPYR